VFAPHVLVVNIFRHLSKEQKIIIGHFIYSAFKLWNMVVISEEIELFDLEKELKHNFRCKNLYSQSSNQNNEKLYWIPFGKLVTMMGYKAKEYGGEKC